MSFNVVEYLQDLVNDSAVNAPDITCPYELPMDWRIEYEERAAILEYDGGQTRENAETQALSEILNRIRTNGRAV